MKKYIIVPVLALAMLGAGFGMASQALAFDGGHMGGHHNGHLSYAWGGHHRFNNFFPGFAFAPYYYPYYNPYTAYYPYYYPYYGGYSPWYY